MNSNNPLKSIRPWLLLFAGLIVFFSCQKEVLDNYIEKSVPPTMQWAKDYYDESLQQSEEIILKPSTVMSTDGKKGTSRKTNKRYLLWGKSTTAKTYRYDFVETPLNYDSKITPIVKIVSDRNTPPQPNQEIIDAGFDRLIIFKDQNGNIDQRVISYVPDLDYARRHNGNIKHNRIEKLDKDFFGFLQYKTWEGKILFILRIENGIPVKKYKFSDPTVKTTSNISSTSNPVLSPKKTMVADNGGGGGVPPEPPTCSYLVSWDWYQDCYYHYGEEEPFACDAPVVYNVQYSPVPCTTGGQSPPSQPMIIDCDDPLNFYDAACTEEPTGEIRLDSLFKYYPCMVKLIINKLAQNQAFQDLRAPFFSTLPNIGSIPTQGLPNLTYNFSLQDWGNNPNNPKIYALAETNINGSWNSTIYFNKNSLDNASELFVAVSAIHESAHAYANAYLKFGLRGYPFTGSNWAMNIVNYEEVWKSHLSNPNYTDHSIFLMNYFDTMMDIIKAWGGNSYTDKEYAAALLYGMDNPGDAPTSAYALVGWNAAKAKLLKSYQAIITKYNLNQSTFNSFYIDNTYQTPNNKRLPTNCP